MPGRIVIQRPIKTDAQHLERVRAGINASLEIMRQSSSDTFLGRKSQEPFPGQDENGPVTIENNDGATGGSIDCG
jgi:hypothetical protein